MNEKELHELDAWIDGHIFGVKKCHHIHTKRLKNSFLKVQCLDCHGAFRDEGGTVNNGLRRYTTDPAAAMMVLKKCLARFDNESDDAIMIALVNGKPIVCSNEIQQGREAETLPLAICLFAKQLFSK